MLPLLEAIRNKDKQKALEWAQSEHWATVEQLISASSTTRSPQVSFGSNSRTSSSAAVEGSGGGIGVGTEPMAANPPADRPQALWTCSHCTFLNAADLAVCEMCNLPRYS